MISKNVLLVDDHPLIRDSFASIIRKLNLFDQIDEAGTLDEAEAKVFENTYAIVCLDIDLPDGSGINLIKKIKKKSPEAKVMMFTVHFDAVYLQKSYLEGADGYLLKSEDSKVLLQSIQKIISGEKIFSLPAKWFSDHVNNLKSLSEQETKVLYAIFNGETLTNISKDMGISIKTVSTYKTRIFKKLGLENSKDLIKLFVERNVSKKEN